MENDSAKIAIKINGQLTKPVHVKNVEMQGNVWGSLKCTTTMDQLNKSILQQKELVYNYRGDNNIPIGVLGMVDDTLSISKCGISSIQKNAVINSFAETQRLTLSNTKSVVLHIGRKTKCQHSCPTLKVHQSVMKEVTSAKYLGDIITVSGGAKESIEDCRSKGWGKVANMCGILSELPSDHRVKICLKMRDAKLANGMLFSTEAWSSITDREMDRIEQVDLALFRTLMDGHSKCSKVFTYLEFGLLSFRHLITIRRLMFHQHILARGDDETIKKVYMKQKEHNTKGDWIQMLRQDFEFIQVDMDENKIISYPKEEYRKIIRQQVEASAFKSYMQLKERSKKKMKNLVYEKINIQAYLRLDTFSLKEKKVTLCPKVKLLQGKTEFQKNL